VYIPTFIRLGFYELGFGSSESGSRVRSSCLDLSSAAAASTSVWSPATVTSDEDLLPAVKMGYVFYQFLVFASGVVRRRSWEEEAGVFVPPERLGCWRCYRRGR